MADLNPQQIQTSRNLRIEGNTLLKEVKSDPKDRIDVEIGDSKQPDFKPQFKLMRWDNEVNFSIRAEEENGAIVEVDGEKVKYKAKDYEVHLYDKPEASDEGGFEFEWILNKRPKSNVLIATINTKGLTFHYQPGLNEENDPRYHTATPTDAYNADGRKVAHKEENTVGCYVAYYADKKAIYNDSEKQYRIGQAFVIYRPHVVDANGNETWGKLSIDVQAGTISVEVDRDWLKDAIYPVIVDPTFGYTTAGTSEEGWVSGDLVVFTPETLSEAGTAVTMHGYGAADSGTVAMKAVIYEAGTPPGNRVALTQELSINTTLEWKQFTISPTVPLTAGDYALGWVFGGSATFRRNSGQTGFNRQYNEGGNYPTPASPFPTVDGGGVDRRGSIYVTYTTGSPSSSVSPSQSPSASVSPSSSISPSSSVSPSQSPSSSISPSSSVSPSVSPSPSPSGSPSSSISPSSSVSPSESPSVSPSSSESPSQSPSSSVSPSISPSSSVSPSESPSISPSSSLSPSSSVSPSQSPSSSVSPSPSPSPAAQNISITASSDDATEETTDSSVTLTDATLDFGNDIHGLRFQSVGIPVGSTIVSAIVRVQASAGISGFPKTVDIYGEDIGDAPTFTTTASDISSRTKTTATESWELPDVSQNNYYDSPDISTIIQEIVNRGDWASGNDIVIIIDEGGSGFARFFYAYDDISGDPAELIITYDLPSPSPSISPSASVSPSSSISPSSSESPSQSPSASVSPSSSESPSVSPSASISPSASVSPSSSQSPSSSVSPSVSPSASISPSASESPSPSPVSWVEKPKEDTTWVNKDKDSASWSEKTKETSIWVNKDKTNV